MTGLTHDFVERSQKLAGEIKKADAQIIECRALAERAHAAAASADVALERAIQAAADKRKEREKLTQEIAEAMQRLGEEGAVGEATVMPLNPKLDGAPATDINLVQF